ncbi:hypothetical protein ABZ079_23780 [Streptomyces sp. NPDC006314]
MQAGVSVELAPVARQLPRIARDLSPGVSRRQIAELGAALRRALAD